VNSRVIRRAAALLGVAATAAALTAARKHRARSRPALVRLEHTPGHRAGTGSPLLLLHGVSATWRVWSPVLPHLESHHDVLAPTLLGHAGASALPPGASPSVGALADGIERELDRAGLDAVHIVGNSLGGWVAIELARRGRARSLVLFSPGGACRSQRRMEATAAAMRLGFNGLVRCAIHAETIASRPALRTLVLCTQVAHPSRVSPDWVAASIRALAAAPAVDGLLQALARDQVEAMPAGQHFPIRLVWPEHDRMLPFRDFGAPMLERIPDAELIRIADVGHVPMSDRPATVARLILEVTTAVDVEARATHQEG
jgi:pimeloyl-ACP methyl ester carboxylesterase